MLVIGALILFGGLERPAETIAAWTAYFGVILVHGCGHTVAARRKGYEVLSIELYPIHGILRFQVPWSRYDDALIACGGVVAQAVIAIPLVVFVSILGYYSLAVAILNLIPVHPLDDAKAWYLVSELIKRTRSRRDKPKRVAGWRACSHLTSSPHQVQHNTIYRP